MRFAVSRSNAKETRTRFLLPVVAALCLGLPTGADAVQPDPADKTNADRHFNQGRQLFEAKRFNEAAREFETAYSIAPHPAVLVNIALSYDESGDLAQAAFWYGRYLEKPFDKLDNEKISKRHAELTSLLGRFDINCYATDCTIWVGGVERGLAPLDLFVKAGSHRIEAVIGGQVELVSIHKVGAGKTVSVMLEPRKADPGPIPAAHEGQVDADDPAASQPAADAGRSLGVGFWVSSGIAIVGGVVTAVFGVRTLNNSEEFKDSGYTDADAKETGERDRLITNIFVGVTAAAAATAVAFAVIGSVAKSERVEDDEDRPTVSLAPGPGLGVGLAASF